MANATMVLISSQVLGTTTASVTFSSIPATYNDLKLVISARSDNTATNGAGLYIILNADSGSNYSDTNITGIGSTVASTRFSNTTNTVASPVFPTSVMTANTFSNTEIYISNYTSTAAKQFLIVSATETNSTTAGGNIVESSLYRGTSAISTINVRPDGNFIANSTFYLYGISNS